MKKIVTSLLLLLFSISLVAQIDYLEPAKPLETYKGELGEYYRNVFTLLNKGLQPKPFARFVAIPSFSPEYSLSVEKRNGRCCLVSNTMSATYWQSEKDAVKVITKSVVISPALYQALGAIFRLVTNQIQDMDGSTRGMDGVVYYFSSTDAKGNIVMGRKWSSSKGPLMIRLMQISQSAYLLSQGGNISSKALTEEATALLNDLQARNKKAPDVNKRPVYAGNFSAGSQALTPSGRKIEEEPRFPCSRPEEYVANQIVYPKLLLAKNVQGHVVCEFIIDKEGLVLHSQIKNSTHPEFAEEVLRIVKDMPTWMPALIDDNPVDSKYVLYIPFRPQIYMERLRREAEYEKNKDHIFVYDEVMTTYKGGNQAFLDFIRSNAKYPEKLKDSGKTARVIVQFTVDVQGKLRDISVARSGGDAAFDNEALRVIKLLPRWNPAADCSGKPKFISCRLTFPINFSR